MRAGRMRYRFDVYAPTGQVTPMGDEVPPESHDQTSASFACDVKELNTVEGNLDGRFVSQRVFELTARTHEVDGHARGRLHFGEESFDASVVSVQQLPRQGMTKVVIAARG